MSNSIIRMRIINKSITTVLLGLVLLGALVWMIPASAQGKLARFGEFAPEATAKYDHSTFDGFLGKYIATTDDNRTIVNYKSVSQEDAQQLENYIDQLEATDVKTLSKAQAYVYWINFYNALTIKVILDEYPLSSIKKINFGFGPWGKKLARVNGVRITLNNIEHDILRAHWSDPRTHYSVNCASYGCPNLQPVAYTVDNVEELLEKGAIDFINHPRGISVDANGNIQASSIYEWYQVDFGDSEQGVLEHVRKYASEDLLAKLDGKNDIARFDYGWDLNEK